MRQSYVDNLRKRDKTGRVIHEERRLVNGAELLYMVGDFTLEDIPMTLASYLWTGRSGVVMVILGVPRGDWGSLRDEAEDALNGFVPPDQEGWRAMFFPEGRPTR
jgi:hypothetical protein